MFSKFQLIKKFYAYYFTASNSKGHGMHSPFVFDFITKVLNDTRTYYCYSQVEALRQSLLHNNDVLTLEDFGAGSRLASHHQRAVSFIAKSSLKPRKFSQLFFRIVDHYQPQTIVELGTSLGVTTAYMASARPDAQVITMEGATAVAALAKENFNKLGLKNIQIVQGNFDDTLPGVLKKLQQVDVAFVDGNHRKHPTLNYFHQLLAKSHDNTILIFDDIHWSAEMEEAWAEIQAHPQVTLTVDLFFIGLVFFRKEQKVKQHFKVRF